MRNIYKALVAAGAAALIVAAVAVAGYGGSGSLDDAAAATAKFHDLSVVKAAGYGLLKDKAGLACIADTSMAGMQMGAMGYHYANPKLVGDGALDADSPEAVVYDKRSGSLKLAALEYVVLQSAWAKTHTAAPSLFGHRFMLTTAPNRFGLPAFWSLHVWIYKHNPAGTFAMWNPTVHCPGSKS